MTRDKHGFDNFGIDEEQQRLEMVLTNMRLRMPRDEYNALLEGIADKHGALVTKGGETSWSWLTVCKGGELEDKFRAALRELASNKET